MQRKKVPPLTDEEEAEIQRTLAEDPDDYEATDEEIAQARPFPEVFPELAESIRRSRGRPPKADAKLAVTLRLDPETVERFKARGPDWRARMGEALRRAARR
jgi:uncharacterized protein (DUF4415 family)